LAIRFDEKITLFTLSTATAEQNKITCYPMPEGFLISTFQPIIINSTKSHPTFLGFCC
jgi:hypothetical protein